MSEKKCCRACLKKIRNRTTFTNILEVPDPQVFLRNGVEATSYLQCYYFSLHSSYSNIENLSDYSYICGTCKINLLKVVEFIVQSQRNEGFLMSMYDIGKHDTVSDIAEHLLDNDTAEESENELSMIDEKEHMIDEFADEPAILEDDLLNANIYEFSNTTTEMEIIEEEYIEEDIQEENNYDELETFSPIIMENSRENSPETNQKREEDYANWECCDEFEQQLGQQMTESVKRPSKVTNKVDVGDNGKWKTIPRDIFNLEFKCILCRKNFNLQRHLYEHYDSEHEQTNLTFPCDICKRRHISQKALTFHKHSVHNSTEYEDCNLCGQVILPTFMKAHKERHKNAVQYSCCECDRTVDRLCTIKQHHRALHEKDKLRRYECTDCDRHFFSEEKLNAHRMVHDENAAVSEKDFLCHICSKTFVKKIDLQLHLKVHKGNIMKCPHCSKEFVRPKDMEYHMRTHTKDFPFKCQVCSRGFAVRWSYDAHIKQHEGFRYKCEHCEKEYIYLSALRVHSYEHRGFPLTCKLCGKGYGVRKKLRNHLKNTHLRSHDGQLSDAAIDEYMVRNKIPHLYVKGQYVDDESDLKED